MIDRKVWCKNFFSEHNGSAKNIAWKFLTVTRKSSKKRNVFTQLWR